MGNIPNRWAASRTEGTHPHAHSRPHKRSRALLIAATAVAATALAGLLHAAGAAEPASSVVASVTAGAGAGKL